MEEVPVKEETTRSLSRWVPSVTAILGVAVGLGASFNKIDSHVDDTVVHMPYQQKVEVFVPRTEVENMIKLLHDSVRMTVTLMKDSEERTEADISRINDQLDRIEELLLEHRSN